MDNNENNTADGTSESQGSVFEQTPDYAVAPSATPVDESTQSQPEVFASSGMIPNAADATVIKPAEGPAVVPTTIEKPVVEAESPVADMTPEIVAVGPEPTVFKPEVKSESIVSDAKPMETTQVGAPSRSTKLADIGKQEHEQHNIIAILISVVVVIGLVAIGYLAYSGDGADGSEDNQPEPQSQSQDSQSQSEQEGIAPIDSTELDEQSSDIDSLINEIDAIDNLQDSEISDESLGL